MNLLGVSLQSKSSTVQGYFQSFDETVAPTPSDQQSEEPNEQNEPTTVVQKTLFTFLITYNCQSNEILNLENKRATVYIPKVPTIAISEFFIATVSDPVPIDGGVTPAPPTKSPDHTIPTLEEEEEEENVAKQSFLTFPTLLSLFSLSILFFSL